MYNTLCLLMIMFIQLVINLTNVGVITYASIYYAGLSDVSYVVLFGTIGSVLALLVFNYVKNKIYSLYFYLVVLLCFSILSWFVPYGIFWLIIFCFLLSALNFLLSTSMAIFASIVVDDISRKNKKMQIANTIGVLLGVTLSPLIVATTKDLLFFVIMSSCLITFIGFLIILKNRSLSFLKEDVKINNNYSYIIKSKFNLWLSTVLVWVAGGFFYVIEVPILKQRFNYSTNDISTVFFISVLFNILAVFLIPKKAIEKYNTKVFLFSTLLCIFCSSIYANSQIWFFVPAIVALYGFANGVFNITSLSSMSSIKNSGDKIFGYLFLRLSSQLGLGVSAFISSFCSLNQTVNILTMLSIVFIFLIVIYYFQYGSRVETDV